MIEATRTIEKYQLYILSLIRQINEIEKLIENKENIRQFSKRHPDKVKKTILKLRGAKTMLYEAAKLLLDSGAK